MNIMIESSCSCSLKNIASHAKPRLLTVAVAEACCVSGRHGVQCSLSQLEAFEAFAWSVA